MTFKRLFVRSAVTLSMPVILAWAYVDELLDGIGFAFRQAWLEVKIEWDNYRRQMKRMDY